MGEAAAPLGARVRGKQHLANKMLFADSKFTPHPPFRAPSPTRGEGFLRTKLDGSLDRFIDFMLLFSYFWLPITPPWLPLSQWICLAMFFAIMPSFEVAYANHRKAVIDPDETIIWRILNRGEMYLLMLVIPINSLYNSLWAGYLLIALVMLSGITTLQTIWIC